MSDLKIRDADPEDFVRLNEIYNWTIVDNHVSFDDEPYDLEKRLDWWEERDRDLVCLVAEEEGRVVGFSYSSRYQSKSGYRSTVETTIVVDVDHLGKGLGTALLAALLDRLEEAGVHVAIAVVALPNDASVALHLRLGYREVGVLHEVGYKNAKYWDTMILQKRLDKKR